MILCDVNVLVYAFRSDSVDHVRYREWLEDIVNGSSDYAVSPQVLAAIVRICTHSKIFAQPSTAAEAFAFCKAFIDQSNAVIVETGERHWSIFEALCRKSSADGNLIQDAWFAAIAIESGCEWITNDRDYSRFEHLRWRTPFN
ncbi:MAG: type II toxin-antitoxin system VapC family toxin [Proteobacteria bacterium]|nr:type II toxin-antitoxin system VapC family toxin [Pseudomonadota bacterium]